MAGASIIYSFESDPFLENTPELHENPQKKLVLTARDIGSNVTLPNGKKAGIRTAVKWTKCSTDTGHEGDMDRILHSEHAFEAATWRWCPENATAKQNLFYLRVHKTGYFYVMDLPNQYRTL